MFSYQATFSDGTVKTIAKSTREYSAAWQIKIKIPGQSTRTRNGFARTRDLAAKAMMSESAIDRTGLYKRKKLHEPGEIVSSEIVAIQVTPL